jgi:hypothetical protein
MNESFCYVGKKVIYKCSISQEDVQTMSDIAERDGVSCVFVEETG